MRKTLFLIYFTLGLVSAKAQDTSRVKMFQFSNAYLLLERIPAPPQFSFDIPFESESFNIISKNREVFLDKFQSERSSFSITALAGFKIRNKEKTGYRKSSLLRAGISYSSSSEYGYYSNAYSFRSDTVLSGSGTNIYVDSSVIKNSLAEYYSDKIWLDFSFVFSTNPEARFSLYEGIGTTFGFGVRNKTKYIYAENKYLKTTDAAGNESFSNFSNPDYHDYTATHYNNQNTFDWGIYIPLGIDFRLGNRNNFLRHVHLFYELRAGIIYNNIGSDALSSEYLRHQFGLRVKW